MSYTPELLDEFDRITKRLSSQNQMERINARFEVGEFEDKHGREVCLEMFAELKRRDAASSQSQEGK